MRTIFVLQDDSLDIKAVRDGLKPLTVVEPANAVEALLRFIDQEYRLDLLVADRGTRKYMPIRSGIQLALHLRTILPDLPVILTSEVPLTAWDARDSADLQRLGARSVAILEKPFQVQSLFKAIRDLIGEPQTELARTS